MHNLILRKTKDGRSLELGNDLLPVLLSKINTEKVLVSLQPMRDKATLAQRGYYFGGIVSAFAEEMGMHVEEVHEYLKLKCNPVQYVNPKTGEITIISGSTSKLNKHSYAQYIDRCIMELAEQGFLVLTPEEYFKSISPKENYAVNP
jgi:protein tyrosine phosphatase